MTGLQHNDLMFSAETFALASLGQENAISAFVNSAYRGESSKRGWTTEADLLGGQRTDAGKIAELIEAQNTKNDRALWVLWRHAQILACVFLEKKDQSTAYLGMLTVEPTLQAKGTGRRVLEFSENFARSHWQSTRVEMTVIHQRRELIDWYLRRGYFLSNEKRAFPKEDQRFGIPKTSDLEFVVLEKSLNTQE
jgi:GNAT superfamily N-acetyltransferase